MGDEYDPIGWDTGWSVAQAQSADMCDKLKQNLHLTALALPENARFQSVESITAQLLVVSVAAH